MKAKILILPSYLCLYVTSVVSEDRSWRTKWSHIYKEEDTVPNAWETSGQFEGDIITSGDTESEAEISTRNIAKNRLWPDGIVPYVFADGYTDEEKKKILNVMEELRWMMKIRSRHDDNFERFCQVIFVPKTKFNKNYVEITKYYIDGCASYDVGMRKGIGKQILNLGSKCLTRYGILHELLHVLGFAHQQSTPDRDKYVTIVLDNIEGDVKHNFDKLSSDEYTDYGLGYDFDSIMHYPPYAFAKKNAEGKLVGPTIISKVPNRNVKANTDASIDDYEKLKKMYCH